MANLGDRVQDTVSGFKGIVLAKIEALFEASQVRVHPEHLHDGEIAACVWLEEDRVVVLEKHAVVGFANIKGREQVEESKTH